MEGRRDAACKIGSLASSRNLFQQVPGLLNKTALRTEPSLTSAPLGPKVPVVKSKGAPKAMKGMKAMKVAPAEKTAKASKKGKMGAKPKETLPGELPPGWKLEVKLRGDGRTDKAYRSPCGRTFDRWSKIVAFLGQ